MRHGHPRNSENKTVNSAGFANWVKNYNQSLVSEGSAPNPEYQIKYSNYYLISSDLPRAIHSCIIFAGRSPEHKSKIFREMEIPRFKLPFTLNAWTWVYLNRVLWMLGKKGEFESYLQAKVRAKAAYEELIKIATKHEKIILFSHGYLILHMRKYLRKKGFIQKQKSNSYWGVSVFEN